MTSLRPTFSIITVTFNCAPDLADCMDSVLNQTWKDFEYILIDGGSTDGTLDIIRARADRLAHWRSEPDRGIYDAINKAIDVARGRWIYVLGADDRLRDSLHLVAPYLRHDHGVYYGSVWFTRGKIRFNGRFSTLGVMKRAICHQALFYPATLFSNRRYDLKYKLLADYHLLLEHFNDARFEWSYLDIIIADYNDSDGASSRFKDVQFDRDKSKILRTHFPWYLVFFRASWVAIRNAILLRKSPAKA